MKTRADAKESFARTGLAHRAQKSASGGFSTPHFGHTLRRGLAHWTHASVPSGLCEQGGLRIDCDERAGQIEFVQFSYTITPTVILDYKSEGLHEFAKVQVVWRRFALELVDQRVSEESVVRNKGPPRRAAGLDTVIEMLQAEMGNV